MPSFERGDVVIVDLGMTAKVRPCVVVSIGQPDRQRNMSVVVPMTRKSAAANVKSLFQNQPGSGRNPS